jgi:hypothetical protein
MQKRVPSFIFLFTLGLSVFGQLDSLVLETETSFFPIAYNGILFQNQSDVTGFQNKNYSGKKFINRASTWLLAEADGSKYAAMNNDTVTEWWPGPIDTFSLTAKSPEDWRKLWLVSQTEIKNHQQNYTQSSYFPPFGIANWPANLEEEGLAKSLAPFVDFNQDAQYISSDGDYPFVPGDYNAFYVANDRFGEHRVSGAQPLGIEVRGMVYSHSDQGLEHVIFIEWYLINRSSNTYSSLYFGQSIQFALGKYDDNAVQTDVNNNVIFGFNGDETDEGEEGFGEELPSAFFGFLNQQLYSSCSFDSPDIKKRPENREELFEIMEGNWSNGENKYLENDGVSGNTPTRFAFPGFTGENTSIISTEKNAKLPPGKREVLATTKIDKPLIPGGFIKIDGVYGYALDKSIGYQKALQAYLSAQKKYESTAYTKKSKQEKYWISNPKSIGERIDFPLGTKSFWITNSRGEGIVQKNINTVEELYWVAEGVPTGLYFVRYMADNQIFTNKLLIIE